jgi:hypothetical protein
MALETFGISLGLWLRNQLSIPRTVIVEPKHNILYSLFAIIATPSGRLRLGHFPSGHHHKSAHKNIRRFIDD